MNALGLGLSTLIAMTASAAAAAGAGTSARQVQIVLVGPESARRELESAIHTVLGEDPDLTWLTRELVPSEILSAPTPPGGLRQLWVDLSDSARVRILVPARGPAVAATERTVDAVASHQAGHEAAMRETVTQIVSATVRALRDDPVPISDPEDVLTRSPAPVNEATPGPYSLAMAFGEHTSQFQVSKPFHDSAWQGLSTSVALRRESQVALFEARVTGEVSDSDTYPTVYQLQLYSVTLGASRRFEAGRLSFGLGVELGGLFARLSPPDIRALAGASIILADSSIHWSAVFLLGLTSEANFAVTPRVFLHLAAALPMAVTGNGSSGLQSASYAQLLFGAGFYL